MLLNSSTQHRSSDHLKFCFSISKLNKSDFELGHMLSILIFQLRTFEFLFFNVVELREKIKSSERQNQRLREVFKTTSHEFREAVYQLFGYKVDGLANKIYRLSSLYSEAPDDHLLFKVTPNKLIHFHLYLLQIIEYSNCSQILFAEQHS